MSPERKRFYPQPENRELEPNRPTAIIYAGQGQGLEKLRIQCLEIGKHPSASAIFNQADEFLRYTFPDRFKEGFTPIIREGPEAIIRQNQQLLVLLYNLACTKVLEQQEAQNGFRFPSKPNIVAVSGQSLGLISAIHASGAIDLQNMLILGVERQDTMQEANSKNPGTLVILFASDSDERVKTLKDDYNLETSIITGSNLVVLGGRVDDVNNAIQAARGKIRATNLQTDGAFHSSLMKLAAERLKQSLQNITIIDAQIPVIANTTGNEIHTSRRIKKEIIDQLTKPVLWLKSTKRMTNKVEQFVEIGNDGLLTGHIKREIENSTGEKDSLVKRLLQASGLAIDAIGATLVIRQPLKGNPL